MLRCGGARQAGEVLDGVAGDVAVGVGRLQVAAQEIRVEVLALEVGGDCADQEMVVGEGVDQGVQDQALPLAHAVLMVAAQALGAVKVGVDLAAVVGDQRQQLRRHPSSAAAGYGAGAPVRPLSAQPNRSLVDNERMDVPELLESASLLVPEETATENDITVRDIWDYLVHDEWEIALGLLEELGDGRSLPLAFWEKLADAADQLRLERSAAWCGRRSHNRRFSQKYDAIGFNIESEHWMAVIALWIHQYRLVQPSTDVAKETAEDIESLLALKLSQVHIEVDLLGCMETEDRQYIG